MAGIGKALVHGVGVQQRASANESQLFEVIKNLHGFDIEQVVMVEQSFLLLQVRNSISLLSFL
jgi:hypothetical protein